MENPQNQVAQSISSANNVLVTVSNNPSVDQLAAAIGLALLLNKMGKHATAVFSGQIPSTIEFLEPEKTLEKNTDSLRDFIIALDKSKADKLRYKVEDKLVKIFITPYRTSIDQKDLEFSQGDFNVDAVIGLGVKQKEQLDQAITSHGRILHDAVVISINNDASGELGTQHWVDTSASSLCEMVVSLIDLMKTDADKDKILLDSQTATAFLTGIVAETQRFSNARTTATTMKISSELLAAGANQELVATKLEPTPLMGKSNNFDPAKLDELVNETNDSSTSSDGAMKINHTDEPKEKGKHSRKDDVIQDSGMQSIDRSEPAPSPAPEPAPIEANQQIDSPQIPNFQNQTQSPSIMKQNRSLKDDFYPYLIEQPPLQSGSVNPNDGSIDNYANPDIPSLTPTNINSPILSHGSGSRNEIPTGNVAPIDMLPPMARPDESPVTETKTITQLKDYINSPHPVDPAFTRNSGDKTLSELERYVNSPHLGQQSASQGQPTPPQPATYAAFEQAQNNFPPQPQLDSARNAVNHAMASADDPPMAPIAALNANPINLDLGHNNIDPEPQSTEAETPLPQISVNSTTGMPQFAMPGAEPPIVDTAAQMQPPQPAPQPLTPPQPTIPPQPVDTSMSPAASSLPPAPAQFVTPPPAVPPPMMPPSFTPPQPQNQAQIIPPVL